MSNREPDLVLDVELELSALRRELPTCQSS